MKILHLQTELNISCGITKMILSVAINSPPGYLHSVFTMGGDNLELFSRHNITVRKSGYKKSVVESFLICSEIFKLVKNEKIDLLHSYHRYFDLIASLISSVTGIRTVTSVQSKVYGKQLLSYKSKTLVVPCESMKYHLRNYFGIDESRIEVINNCTGYNDNTVKISKRDLNIDDDSKIILFVGRFSRQKGVDIMVRSMFSVQSANPKVILILAGAGEEESELRSYLLTHGIRSIIVNPVIELSPYYVLADIVVLPSRVDPFPIVMLETGMAEKPFIGSDVDGISEFIQNGIDGILVRPENISQLRDAILLLLKDYDYAKYLASNLSEKVRAGYTPEIIIPKYLSLYERL